MMDEELDKLRKELSIREELESLKEENKLLKEKIRDYEVILSIENTDTDTIVCEHQRLDNIAYYCDKYDDYMCYPVCRKDKDCFRLDKTFQVKLEDLKRVYGDKWYGEEKKRSSWYKWFCRL